MFHGIEEEPINHRDLLNAPKTKAMSHHFFFRNVWAECKRRDTPNNAQKLTPTSKEGL
jgi:hypothetical protein